MRKSASARRHAEGTIERESPTPRVCLLTETFYPVVGGGETYARVFARALNDLGMGVFIITRRSKRELESHELIDGIEVFRVSPTRGMRLGKYAMLPFVAAGLFRMRGSYDIVYVSNFRILGVLGVVAARVLRKKCVLRGGTCGEISGSYAAGHGVLSRLAAMLLSGPFAFRRCVLRRADAFVGISSAIVEEFLQCGVPEQKIVLLPSGVDISQFRPVDGDRKRELRAKLGLPVTGFLVGYSGKLNRGKGLNHLIAAAVELARQHDDIHVVLIGSGSGQFLSCESDLRDMVCKHGIEDKVTFTGYVTNVQEYLCSLDAFAFPTENEALGNALLEAMACGLPAVASRVGGVPDILTDGIDGLLVPPGRPQALVEAICALKADPSMAARLASAARATIESRFSLENLARQHLDFLASIAGGSPGHKEAELVA